MIKDSGHRDVEQGIAGRCRFCRLNNFSLILPAQCFKALGLF